MLELDDSYPWSATLTCDDIDEVTDAHGWADVGRSILGQLSARESEVLRLRHGFGDRAPMTLDEIGRVIGVTRERIRQIESKAHTCLRDRLHRDGSWRTDKGPQRPQVSSHVVVSRHPHLVGGVPRTTLSALFPNPHQPTADQEEMSTR